MKLIGRNEQKNRHPFSPRMLSRIFAFILIFALAAQPVLARPVLYDNDAQTGTAVTSDVPQEITEEGAAVPETSNGEGEAPKESLPENTEGQPLENADISTEGEQSLETPLQEENVVSEPAEENNAAEIPAE